jgi:hypothetical protein
MTSFSSGVSNLPSVTSPPGNGPTDPCPLEYLAVFPQGTLSTAQGFTGTHHWYVRGPWSNVIKKIRVICDSHWPGMPDAVPVTVQWGPPDQQVRVAGNIALSELNKKLPEFDQYQIVAQYQLLHISDPWPISGKPGHPKGSVLALQVRGNAEVMQVDPAGVVSSGKGSGRTGCMSEGSIELVQAKTFNSRFYCALTEYHLIADRLTDAQLCYIMHRRPWRDREGTVNAEVHDPQNKYNGGSIFGFLSEPEGTLYFDNWTLDQTFAPDIDNPRRWRLACTLKCRQIADMLGPYPEDCLIDKYPVGWNHDYKRNNKGSALGWRFVMMQMDGSVENNRRWTPHGVCPTSTNVSLVPKYPYVDFGDMFGYRAGEDEATVFTSQSPFKRCGALDYNVRQRLMADTSTISCDSLSPFDQDDILQQTIQDASGAMSRKTARDEQDEQFAGDTE